MCARTEYTRLARATSARQAAQSRPGTASLFDRMVTLPWEDATRKLLLPEPAVARASEERGCGRGGALAPPPGKQLISKELLETLDAKVLDWESRRAGLGSSAPPSQRLSSGGGARPQRAAHWLGLGLGSGLG